MDERPINLTRSPPPLFPSSLSIPLPVWKETGSFFLSFFFFFSSNSNVSSQIYFSCILQPNLTCFPRKFSLECGVLLSFPLNSSGSRGAFVISMCIRDGDVELPDSMHAVKFTTVSLCHLAFTGNSSWPQP